MAFQVGDKYYHEDYESGYIIEISKFAYDNMRHQMSLLHEKINSSLKIKGTIQVIGTMQDDSDNNSFKDLWNDFNK